MRIHKILFIGLLIFALPALAAQKAPAKAEPTPAEKTAECLTCHSDPTLSKEVNGKTVSLHVDEKHFKDSIHGGMFGCTECHTDIKGFPHDPVPAKVSCQTCHADEVKAYESSWHAQARAKGNTKAADCLSCHGNAHEITVASDPKSRVNHNNIPMTCGSCHGQKFVMESSGLSAAPFFAYQESVHGKAVAAGSQKAAVCTDCHNAHDILSAADPKSPIFKFNVPTTCAKCHQTEKQEFMASVHGKAVARGSSQSPVCTDCHGIHGIRSHKDPQSPVSAAALAQATCARCHESVRMAQELGIEGSRTSSFMASYHGLATSFGSKTAANCASCHGVHKILPSSDPHSTVNQANLITTCGTCHPGATQKFVGSKIHVDTPLSADIGSISIRWIRRIYLSLIFAVIGGMALHNLIIWRRKAVEKRKSHAHTLSVVRMDKRQRIQHLLLLTSFIALVFTGFALKYPDSWMAWALGWNEPLRRGIHRVAAVVMIVTSLYHVCYLAFSRGGRKMFKDMFPTPADATDVVKNLGYYLGLSKKKPEFQRFNYAEKAEYWALVWGTIVMAVTGCMLWFKIGVGYFLPRWGLDIATAIHFYEAILATLAIIVWHFYQVIFDPDVYPMNWAWYDGKMSVEHYSEEHGLDRETIDAVVAAEAEKNAAPTEKEETKKEGPKASSADNSN